MKRVRWLITLADEKPLLFSVALLLIGITVLSFVVDNLNKERVKDKQALEALRKDYEIKTDSLHAYYRREIQILNIEYKLSLSNILNDYRNRLEEQEKINNNTDKAVQQNKRVISENKSKLKILQNEISN